jgi:uncharacterized membrane protein YfcA
MSPSPDLDLSSIQYGLLAVAAALGGGLNAVAGGGSFLTFPTLLLIGVSPIAANATSAVALWPGSLASAFALREEVSAAREKLRTLAPISALGGLLGALLLLRTPSRTFVAVLPFLLLTAALVFTFGPRIRSNDAPQSSRPSLAAGLTVQFAIALYGGYFGGGMGIVMLAAFSAMRVGDLHVMNALKAVLAAFINLVAIVAFVVGGAVEWRPGVVMIAASTLGGYYGSRTARRFPSNVIRRAVLVVAWSLTAYFFWRAR